MPSKGTRSKDVSPVPSSEPRAPSHKSSHPSASRSGSTAKKPGSQSRGSKPASKPGSKPGSKQPTPVEGSKNQAEHDVEAPPSREDTEAGRSAKERGPLDWALFPFALLGFAVGLLVGVIIVLFAGFFCCIFADWRSVWCDKRKRAFLGGFATGVLIAIIVWVALFIALAVG